MVAVPPDRDNEPVQSFRTFTTDLQRLADWLVACRITSVALESTGVFWIPIYEILAPDSIATTTEGQPYGWTAVAQYLSNAAVRVAAICSAV